MNDVVFSSSTPNISLPLLYSAQAQKEFVVNESLALLDVLVPGVVRAVCDSPPADAAEGQVFIVGSAPADGFKSATSGQLALLSQGGWRFLNPIKGMRLHDNQSGRDFRFDNAWISAERPAVPTEGAIQDIEVRACLATLIEQLSAIGLFAPV